MTLKKTDYHAPQSSARNDDNCLEVERKTLNGIEAKLPDISKIHPVAPCPGKEPRGEYNRTGFNGLLQLVKK